MHATVCIRVRVLPLLVLRRFLQRVIDHAYHRDPSRVPGSRSRRHIARTRRLPTYMYTRAVESGFHGNGRARGRDAFNKYLLVGDRPAAARL